MIAAMFGVACLSVGGALLVSAAIAGLDYAVRLYGRRGLRSEG